MCKSENDGSGNSLVMNSNVFSVRIAASNYFSNCSSDNNCTTRSFYQNDGVEIEYYDFSHSTQIAGQLNEYEIGKEQLYVMVSWSDSERSLTRLEEELIKKIIESASISSASVSTKLCSSSILEIEFSVGADWVCSNERFGDGQEWFKITSSANDLRLTFYNEESPSEVVCTPGECTRELIYSESGMEIFYYDIQGGNKGIWGMVRSSSSDNPVILESFESVEFIDEKLTIIKALLDTYNDLSE